MIQFKAMIVFFFLDKEIERGKTRRGVAETIVYESSPPSMPELLLMNTNLFTCRDGSAHGERHPLVERLPE